MSLVVGESLSDEKLLLLSQKKGRLADAPDHF
jgi:hypothetical protein